MFAIQIIVKNSLYAIRYSGDETDIFTRLFNKWQDPEYLDKFFYNHKEDLQNGFYGNISIEEAVQKTIDETFDFQQKLLVIAEKGKGDLSQSLQTLFVPLNNYEKEIYPIPEYQKSKVYGSHKSWLRIYAIRIDENVYIITGGAIKLTKTMNEREHLKNELKRLEEIKQFLTVQGIIDNDSIVDFLELEI